MSRENRASEIDLNNRILIVVKAILKGYTKRSFLLQYISDKYESWGLHERQIDNYIKQAKDIIKNDFTKKDLEIEKDIALSRLESLFVMNMNIQDYRECRNVTLDRMKLLGLLIDKKTLEIEAIKPIETIRRDDSK